MKKIIVTAIVFVGLLAPTSYAHAGLLGFGSCGAASAVQGAVSQAASKIANTIGSKAVDKVTDKITNKIAGGGGREAPVKDKTVRKNTSTIIKNTDKISNNTNTLVAKECIGDALAFAIKEGIIAAMTQSIIDWINSGFEGGPSFVTNLNGFLDEVADHTSLDFIRGTELGFLCSPFQLEVRLALATQRQPFKERIRCSLGDVAGNVEGFIGGDFRQGGWPAWFRLHAQRQNIPYGGYALALGELQVRIGRNQSEELRLLEFGGGFFSKRECVRWAATSEKIGGETTTGERQCLRWEIVTPGAQINDQLSQVLGSGFRQLELADEINEIINALMAQLAQQALSGVNGVSGLSNRSSSSARSFTDDSGNSRSGSYLEALVNETSTNSILGARQILLANIESAIELEEEYTASVEPFIGLLRDTANAEYQCYAQTQTEAVALARAEEIDFYENSLESSRAVLETLEALHDEAVDARSAEELNGTADAYDAVLASGFIHSTAEIDEVIVKHASLTEFLADTDLVSACGAPA